MFRKAFSSLRVSKVGRNLNVARIVVAQSGSGSGSNSDYSHTQSSAMGSILAAAACSLLFLITSDRSVE